MSLPSFHPPQRVRPVARLVAVLDRSETLAARSRGVDDWGALLETAFDQGVGGLLVCALADAGVELPRSAAERAERVMARDRLWSRKLLADLVAVQEALGRAAVRAVTLKGPALAQRIYPDAALRPAGDLDFLVTPATFEEAASVLRTLGYEEKTPRENRRREPHAVGFESPERVRVELHRQASSKFATTLAAEPLVARSIVHRLPEGCDVRILEPADELLYLAVHAARHRFARLRWLWEVGASMERCDASEMRRLVERAREEGVGRAVAVTLGVLHRRLENEAAGECARRLSQGLLFRAELRIAGVAADPSYRQGGLLRKSLFVVCDHAYRALLSETPSAAMKHWAGSMRRSIANLLG